MRLALLAAALAVPAPASAADPARYMPAELIAETASPVPGSTILLGFRMTPKDSWHGYWSNPGDSGIAPTVRWTAPDGVSFGPLLHPAPTLLTSAGISSYVHEGPHILLSRMTIGKDVAPGMPIPIEAKLNWAACTADQCVPLRATFRLELAAGDGSPGPERKDLRTAAAKLPRAASNGSYQLSGENVRLLVPESLGVDARSLRFFPDRNDAFDTAAAKPMTAGGETVLAASGEPAGKIAGVLSDGKRAYRITFAKADAAPPPTEEPAAEPTAAEQATAPLALRPAAPAEAPARTAVASDLPGTSWLWPASAAGLLLAGATFLMARRRRS